MSFITADLPTLALYLAELANQSHMSQEALKTSHMWQSAVNKHQLLVCMLADGDSMKIWHADAAQCML